MFPSGSGTVCFHRLHVINVAAAAVFLVGHSTIQAGDGIDVLLEACHNRGDNPAVIQSLSVGLEAHILTEPNEEEIDRRIEQQKQVLLDTINRYEEEQNESMVERLKKALETFEDWCPPQILEQFDKRLRVQLLYRWSPETGHFQYRFRLVQFDATKNKWGDPIEGIRELQPRGAIVGTFFDSGINTATVNSGAFNAGIADVRQFGRIQGLAAMMVTAAFVDPAQPDRLDFSEERIQRFKTELMARLGANDNVTPFQIVRQQGFENSMVYVLETSRADKGKTIPLQRYWIDAARGYLCPLVQLLDEHGRLAVEWRSKDYFLHEKSGLWFPAHHSYTEYNPETGKVRKKEDYTISAKTLRLNQPIADEEFSLEIPADVTVMDVRKSRQIRYRTTGPTKLSLEARGLDLNSKKTLIRLENHPRPPTVRTWTIVILLINVAVFALIAAFLWVRRKRKRSLGPAVCVLFALCLTEAGCSRTQAPSPEPQDRLTVEPQVLDFGRARQKAGPLELAFTIANRSDRPVSISEIKTGCGCTVARLSSPVIGPGQRATVPVSVQLHGRLGPFSTRVSVYTSDHPDPLQVQVQGTIVRDIWYNGDLIRCSAGKSDTSASGTFEVNTLDWPNVRFDLNAVGESFSVRELSRSTNMGETVIRFEFTTSIPLGSDSAARHLVLVPMEEDLDPLKIPVVVYRTSRYQEHWADNVEGELRPVRIALGALQSGSTREFRIFGDPEILRSLSIAEFTGFADGIEFKLAGESDKCGTRTILVRVAESVSKGFFKGRIRFISSKDREYSIAVLGMVRNQPPHPILLPTQATHP